MGAENSSVDGLPFTVVKSSLSRTIFGIVDGRAGGLERRSVARVRAGADSAERSRL